VAALLKEKLHVDTELVVGGRGEFTVWVGDHVVARKTEDGFPDDGDVLAAVQTSLTKTS
jgi:hypothetical protein